MKKKYYTPDAEMVTFTYGEQVVASGTCEQKSSGHCTNTGIEGCVYDPAGGSSVYFTLQM